MTIDECISHCKEVAKENREYAEDALDRYNLVPNEITKQEHDRCKQCAAEYQQLAEWLKDYKRLLEREPCEDAISRQAVLDMMQMRMGGKELYKAVYDLPPVTPRPKIGH